MGTGQLVPNYFLKGALFLMRIIDTKDAILSADNHPSLKIGDKFYIVDDRRSTWKKIEAVQNDDSIIDKDDEIIRLALGKDAAKEILENRELSVLGFNNLTFYIMSAITGEDYEDLKKAARERKN